jgi:hypothetical protein
MIYKVNSLGKIYKQYTNKIISIVRGSEQQISQLD